MLLDGLRGTLNQSALEPSGPQAAKIAHLWWFAFIIASVVYILTMGALWCPRRRGKRPTIIRLN